MKISSSERKALMVFGFGESEVLSVFSNGLGERLLFTNKGIVSNRYDPPYLVFIPYSNLDSVTREFCKPGGLLAIFSSQGSYLLTAKINTEKPGTLVADTGVNELKGNVQLKETIEVEQGVILFEKLSEVKTIEISKAFSDQRILVEDKQCAPL